MALEIEPAEFLKLPPKKGLRRGYNIPPGAHWQQKDPPTFIPPRSDKVQTDLRWKPRAKFIRRLRYNRSSRSILIALTKMDGVAQ